MNKLVGMVASVVVASSALISYGRPAILDIPDAEYRARLDAVMACTNVKDAVRMLATTGMVNNTCRKSLRDIAAEYDPLLARKGVTVSRWTELTSPGCCFPQCATNSAIAVGAYDKVPTLIAVAGKLRKIAAIRYIAGDEGLTIEDAVALLSEQCRPNSLTKSYEDAVRAKKAVQHAAAAAVRVYLKQNGMPFVTKNGVNPCSEKLEALNTCLNAGYMAGLNDWLSGIGLACRVDVSGLPSQQEIASLRSSIVSGRKELKGDDRYYLYLCLGTDGYNEFVKEYNGD